MPEHQPTNAPVLPTPAPDQQELQPPQPFPTSGPPQLQRLPYWLQQLERFLRVIVRIYLGLLVCFAPWYPPAWDMNPLFMSSPTLMNWITTGAIRGLVSGVGLLNLWIALRDAIRPADHSGQR